jgi:hypothetical protein
MAAVAAVDMPSYDSSDVTGQGFQTRHGCDMNWLYCLILGSMKKKEGKTDPFYKAMGFMLWCMDHLSRECSGYENAYEREHGPIP